MGEVLQKDPSEENSIPKRTEKVQNGTLSEKVKSLKKQMAEISPEILESPEWDRVATMKRRVNPMITEEREGE